MNYIGSKTIETERLILRKPTMIEQKRLWEILMIPSVNDLYLTVPVKFRDKLKVWEKQEPFYEEKVAHAADGNVFDWCIILKDNNICIGKIDFHERNVEDPKVTDKSIMGVGWFIDPQYQGKGYATEAARYALDYMFREVDIKEIITGAAICNPASWKVMEKLGFKRSNIIDLVNYTYKDEPVEVYRYSLSKEDYMQNCR